MTSILTSTNPAARIAPATTRAPSSVARATEVAQTSRPPGRNNLIISACTTSKDSMQWKPCKAVETLADSERIARRVFGGTHPITTGIESNLREARAALVAAEQS